MSHQFYGVSISGLRHDTPFPFGETAEGTGYEHGVRANSLSPVKGEVRLNESSIDNFLREHLKLDNVSQVSLRLEDAIILNDSAAILYLEDFVAGYEYSARQRESRERFFIAVGAAINSINRIGLPRISAKDILDAYPEAADSKIMVEKDKTDGGGWVEKSLSDLAEEGKYFTNDSFSRHLVIAHQDNSPSKPLVVESFQATRWSEDGSTGVIMNKITLYSATLIEQYLFTNYRSGKVKDVFQKLQSGESVHQTNNNVYK